MERMIINRMYWLIESPTLDTPLLPDNQFGFRKFRSCQDNLTALVAGIHAGFLVKQDTVAVFVDIKSAFDNVLPHVLLQDLCKLDFPPRLLSFISNFISHRSVQFVSQGSISEPRSALKGTPQGSVLSPTLFNLYLRNVNEVLDSDTELLQFADDIVIFSSLKDTEAAINSNQLILPSPTVRFLGVLLDPKLSGKPHMSYIINKGKRILQIIQALRGTWRRAHPHMLLTIYRAMLRASIEYSALIFGLKHNNLSRALQIIQNQALRLCFGYRISTPLNVIFAESGELTLTHRFRLLALHYFLKISSVQQHITVDKLHQLCDLAEFRDLTSDSTLFYTDGSKVDHSTHVGAAVFAPQLQWELMLKLPPYASVFSAEAYAIYTAITLAIDRKLPKAIIITDSKSVLEAVKSFRNPTNNYLIPLIRSVLVKAESKGTEINFIWIPSHRGISGNEKADQLAKRAIRQGIERNFKVPYSDLCAVTKQEISDNFYLYLESQADIKGSFYFTNIFKRSAKPWYFRMNIPRESIVMINRLRSDHYNLNYSLHRKNLIDDPSCPCGSPQQDMIHMIYECPESRGL
ncbi:PREDICTED: uncharacterized protein LOC108763958 [Trachymyrmex cornetzi]|uniref:uncharacterized protein LOC108763958 n=1 Tax=Trachymyrmex cornetzi TaxID=471704 RepID=UPI00084F8260|nr:PREDICTED: uncharacterized protein LOC108763958 [Trachymyrmex cornetzi]